MINRISYFLEEGFQNIFRSKVEALSSITTIFMCILVIGIMYTTFTNVSNTVETIQDDLSLIAYLESCAGYPSRTLCSVVLSTPRLTSLS